MWQWKSVGRAMAQIAGVGLLAIASASAAAQSSTVNLARPASGDSHLANLIVSAGALQPDFDPASAKYVVVVPKESGTIAFSPTHSDAAGTITLNGGSVASDVETAPQPLQVLPAVNNFELVRTAPDGLSSTLSTITVERQLGTNARLVALGVAPAAFAFDPKLDYQTATVDSDVALLTLTPRTEDPDATLSMQLNYGEVLPIPNAAPTDVDIPFGDTVIDLRVTSQDGSTTRIYRHIITRIIDPRTAISRVESSAGSCCGPQPTSANQLIFGFQALPAQRSITLTVRTTDPAATLRLDGARIEQGVPVNIDLPVPNTPLTPRELPLEVTSADGQAQITYTVQLVRQISTDHRLQSLTSPQATLTPEFNTQTYNYYTSVPTGTQLQVVAAPVDPGTQLRWHGGALNAGEPSSPVTVTLGSWAYAIETISESGGVHRYWVNVTGIPSTVNTLDALSASAGELSPAFSSETTAYTLTLQSEITRVSLTARRSHPGSVMGINGFQGDDDVPSPEFDITGEGAFLTVVVRAENGQERTYRVDIIRPNALPTISAANGQTTLEDSPAVVNITVGDLETPADELILSVRSANQALLPDALLAAGLGGSGTRRTLSIIPPRDVNGHVPLTLEVVDGRGGRATHSLLFSIHPVNDAPTFNLEVSRLRVDVSAGPVRVRSVISGARPGPENESSQTMISHLAGVLMPGSNDHHTSSTLEHVGNGVYDLIVTPSGLLGTHNGSALYTTSLRDNGGTEFGGINEAFATPYRLDVVETAGVDLAVSILPVEPSGATRSYDVLVTNHGSSDITGGRLEVFAVRGLFGTTLACTSPVAGQGCGVSVGATGGLSASLNLEVGASAILRIAGDLVPSANFVEIGASISAPSGTLLVEPSDDRAYRVDPVAPFGISANGFE